MTGDYIGDCIAAAVLFGHALWLVGIGLWVADFSPLPRKHAPAPQRRVTPGSHGH